MSDLLPEEMVPICVKRQPPITYQRESDQKWTTMSRNQPSNHRILSGHYHLTEVDGKTLTIRYKFVKFNN